jgi:glycosyltransferase involved in cell wall biosynthesis
MYRSQRVCVVVPAFNEEALICDTLKGIPAFVDHIIVVDDCSTDDTSARVTSHGDPRVSLFRQQKNTGVGGAIISGHQHALDLACDISVVMAGDNQMDPEALPALLDPLIDDGYGFTKGNRFFSRTSAAGMSPFRVAANMALTFMTKAASGYWNLVDPQNGYTAITRGTLEKIPLGKVSTRYEFENDLLIWLNIAEVPVADVPIAARYGAEVSTIRLHRDAPRVTSLLFRGFWRRMWLKYTLWSFSPVALLFFLGLTTLGLGLLVGAAVTFLALHGTSPSAGTTVLAVVPFFCGFVLLVQSLVLDIQQTPGPPAHTRRASGS